MKAAEAVVKILEAEGITDIFGIPGAGINPVYKYIGQSKKLKHYTMRHEEAAVHSADAYFRASGRLAVAMCTSGPGATNFVTGIYTAQIDSIPLIAITGQNTTNLLGKEAFQCVDIADICKPISKATFCITDASALPKIMQEAFQIALSGRPGPVLIDLPLDVQQTEIDFSIDVYQSLPIPEVKPDLSKIDQAIALLQSAKNPVMIMGGGVILSKAEKECVQLAEKLQIPVITTYMSTGGIPENHPLNAGHMGIQVGSPLGNKIFLGSDVVLGIGCRFTDRHTGAIDVYRGDRKFIHIDIEPSQIGKIFEPTVGIVSDAKLAINALLDRIGQKEASERVKNLPALKAELKRKTDFDQSPIKPQRVFYEMNRIFDDETMYTTGCGLNQIWSGQFQEISKPRKYLPSGGAGTLGFDIPAAIGACIAQPGKKCVAVMGDFGFTFLVEELAVAAKLELPLIVIILNNAYLSLIRQNQKYAYEYECAVAMEENQTFVDYVKVSEGFGCLAERVCEPDAIAPALQRAIKANKPYVVEIIVERETDASMGGSVAAVKEFE